MKILQDIKRALVIAGLALSLSASVVAAAQAAPVSAGHQTSAVSGPLFGDGQETHG